MDEIKDTVNVMINNAINQTMIIINDWITNTNNWHNNLCYYM